MLTLAIVAGMGAADVSENGFALGCDAIELPHPVFPGDTLYSESEVVETRDYNHRGDLVIRHRRSVLVWQRDAAPGRGIFPSPTS